MVIDLRSPSRRWAAGALLLSGLWLAFCGGRQVVSEVLAVVSPGPPAIRRVARTDRVVALTVEAVWGSAQGDDLAEALLQAGLPATFFASGRWLEGREALVRRLVQAGYEFGNVTESYPYLDALSPEDQEEEIRRADRRLTRVLGRKPAFFRPPHGQSTPVAEATARDLGYRTVLWSIDALDGRNPPPDLLVDLIERQLVPGAIVRLTTAGETTAQAVPRLAARLKRRGYRAVTLSELLFTDNYYVERETGEQRRLPGNRASERPVLLEWWQRWREGVKRGVTLSGEPVEGLLPAEVRRKAEELARRLDRPAREARWDAEHQAVQPEVAGRRVDVEATVRAVLRAAPGSSVEPVLRQERPRIVREMFSPVYQGKADGRQVALMFNVAWGNEELPGLLAVLQKAGVKATFFVEGRWAERYPDLVRQIAAGGHCLGSHAFYHLDYRKRPRGELLESLARTGQAVARTGAELSPLFAPPAGAVNAEMVRIAAEAGYWTIMWTADTIDWQRPAAAVIRERVTKKLTPGCLVLMHPTAPTVEALPGVLADLKRAGYRAVTVPELLPASWPTATEPPVPAASVASSAPA